MGAGDGQHVATQQNVLGQPLWAAGVGRAGVQNGFHQRKFGCAVAQMGAANHVAHNEHVGFERQLVCAKAFYQINA